MNRPGTSNASGLLFLEEVNLEGAIKPTHIAALLFGLLLLIFHVPPIFPNPCRQFS
jgi:hypothetical protein